MEGLSNKSSGELYKLALSWLQPATITTHSGISQAYYDTSQRAYQLYMNDKEATFSLLPLSKSSVINPAFVINDWGTEQLANLYLENKKLVEGKDFEQGVIYNTEGVRSLVIWVKITATTPLNFLIKK